MAGLDHTVTRQPLEEITAANRISYYQLGAAALRHVLVEPQAALRVIAGISEAQHRVGRMAAMKGGLDARARIGVLFLDLLDRLRRRALADDLSFNLPLTQEQIADHLGLTLVHVNRTLRRMREEGLVLVNHQMVSILNLGALRQISDGFPQLAEIPNPIYPD
jgi:CRP/FNR family transcriptional regulator